MTNVDAETLGSHRFEFESLPKLDEPATYCIKVVGRLDAKWSIYLSGLQIDSTSQKGETTITTLSGMLTDQAALFGVLMGLYNMRLPLLSVEWLEVDS